jgi:DNA mismatch repair protein MSH3
VRKQLKRPALQYKEVALSEYVIEIPNAATKEIPANWTLLSKYLFLSHNWIYLTETFRTKQYSRYHSPEIRAKLLQREQDKEAAAVEANKAWRAFLGEVCEYHSELRAVVNALGELDCLLSMAQVASRPEYSRPKFTTDGSIRIVAGRHPVAEVVRDEPFVPNSLILGGESPSVNIITGPNMGGKSSVVRMLALTCVMAQVGFYVPALSFSLTPVDCILTRMGGGFH